MSRETLIQALRPVFEAAAEIDLKAPDAAERMEARLPLSGEVVQGLRNLVRQGVREGWLCEREADGVRFCRLTKANADTRGFSVDVVHMQTPGPGHTHPNGEIDLCFGVEGEPTFDGRAPGWTVYPPGSWHVPSVHGGVMDIIYLLPEGAIQFGPKPQG